MKLFTALASAAIALLGAQALAANIVVNGSFEATTDGSGNPIMGNTNDGDGAQSVASLSGSGRGSWEVFSGLPGWSVISGSGIELQTQGTLGLTPNAGRVYVELDSHPRPGSNTRIEQTTAVLPTGKYEFSFWYTPRVGNPSTDGIEYGVMPGAVSSMTINGTGLTPGTWVKVTETFTLHSMTQLVLFFEAGGTEDTLGGFIDNVSLEHVATPLPGAAAFLLTGLAGVGLARRKRQA